MGEKMTYRVAMDDKSDGGKGKMAATWMEAAGQRGIPAAFLVDQNGTIAWIGHPARINDEIIQQLLDGKFDTAANAAQAKKEQEAESAAEELLGTFKKSLAEKNIGEATKAVDGLAALDNPQIKAFLPMMRLDLAVAAGDGKAVGEQATAVMDYASSLKNKQQAAFMLTQFSSRLSTAEGVKDLDPKLAVQFAEKASSLSDGKNGAILHTLARAQFVAGDKDAAIASEESAIENAPNESIKAKMQETLAAYKEGKLPAANGK
jgi:tetratricopeptide (TPR) repeat protein